LGDAHLPSQKIAESYALIGLDATLPTLAQGHRLLEIATDALEKIGDKIYDALQSDRPDKP
jgi:hypothetical protein